MGAISFIENLEASSLSITPEEFDQQIEKTMTELSQERAAEVIAVEAAKSSAATSTTASPEPTTGGRKKQDSKLVTLLAGTAAIRNSRPRPPINEKQYLAAEAAQQEKQSSRQPQIQSGNGRDSSRGSPAVPSSGSSILNPAASLIERGANFATKTIQKPLDLIERMFQDSGDEEEMAKPYPPRPQQQQGSIRSTLHPSLPSRSDQQSASQQQQQQQQAQRPELSVRDDSFTEFVYVPAGQQIQQPAPRQASGFFQHPDQQRYPGTATSFAQPLQQEQQQQQQQQSTEEYLQALETLMDMFPSCERQVCDVILQANDGRLSPSIDTLLGKD
jgi:hypothetical protein